MRSRTNKNKVQWKQGTKAREQSKQGKTRNKGKGDRPGKVYFFTTKTKKMKKKEKDSVLHNYNMIITYLKNMREEYAERLGHREWEEEFEKIHYLVKRLDQQIHRATSELTEFISINYLNGDK